MAKVIKKLSSKIRNTYWGNDGIYERLQRYARAKYPESPKIISSLIRRFVKEGLDREGFEVKR